MEQQIPKVAIGKIHCTSCGAELNYKPGTTHLTCNYCQAANDIPVPDVAIEELDFHAQLANMLSADNQVKEQYVQCAACGASSTLDPHISSANCVYCGVSLVLQNAKEEMVIQPKSLLPFKLDKNAAVASFKKWVNALWFVPDKLKKAAVSFDLFKGVYIPYWTFDTRTESAYIGQRGTYYYVTETYTENGQTKTRSERKTRWSNVAGKVTVPFDDILVVGSKSLSQKHIEALEPWDLPNLVPYEKSFLSGFITEKYQVDLAAGFDRAKEIADGRIRQAVLHDIGGDDQQIISVSSQYENITFKHILLPVYVSAYRYKDKLYQFLVNARTGEVQGERPWSWAKIGLIILLGVLILAALILLLG